MTKNVLLVEDDLFIRDLYKRQLSLAGFQIECATTGLEALQKTEQNKFDIILLDIMLPDMNGIDILKKVMANEATKNVPVAMLSNMAQEDIMAEALKIGAKKYLIKSLLTPDEVLTEVNKILLPAPLSPQPQA
jgi:DNA-binding response OmpR family regulator